jgi:hypothetical protein
VKRFGENNIIGKTEAMISLPLHLLIQVLLLPENKTYINKTIRG